MQSRAAGLGMMGVVCCVHLQNKRQQILQPLYIKQQPSFNGTTPDDDCVTAAATSAAILLTPNICSALAQSDF